MKLDNRPRKLLVKGVPEESVEIARNWYGVRIILPPPTPNFAVERESVDNEWRRECQPDGGWRPHCFLQDKKFSRTGMSGLA